MWVEGGKEGDRQGGLGWGEVGRLGERVSEQEREGSPDTWWEGFQIENEQMEEKGALQ